jgi:hypothetical protein
MLTNSPNRATHTGGQLKPGASNRQARALVSIMMTAQLGD